MSGYCDSFLAETGEHGNRMLPGAAIQQDERVGHLTATTSAIHLRHTRPGTTSTPSTPASSRPIPSIP